MVALNWIGRLAPVPVPGISAPGGPQSCCGDLKVQPGRLRAYIDLAMVRSRYVPAFVLGRKELEAPVQSTRRGACVGRDGGRRSRLTRVRECRAVNAAAVPYGSATRYSRTRWTEIKRPQARAS